MNRRDRSLRAGRLPSGRSIVGAVLLLAVPSLFVGLSAHATTLFGLVNTGELFASTDMGVTWSVRATLPIRDGVGIAAGETSSELYLASGSGVLYRSTNAGDTWDAVGSVAAGDVTDLVVRYDGAVLLLTQSGTVYISTDDGASFTAQAALTGSDFASICIPVADSLYALTETGEVAQSTDGGVNWVTVGVITVSDAVNLRPLGTTLYMMTGTGDIFRSQDRGGSWTPVGTLSHVHMAGLTSDDLTLFAATREGEVAVSTDGVSWQWQGSINQLSVTALGTDTPALTRVEEPPYRPLAFSLGQNYPNPFSAGTVVTHIPFELLHGGHVELKIYDVAGRLVRDLFEGDLSADSYSLPWRGLDDEGRRVATGIYSYELVCGGGAARRKLILIR